MEPTQPFDLDEALARILSEPSTAARITAAAADILDEGPHLLANHFAIGYATTRAYERITAGLPEIVADEALRAVADALPVPRLGEYCGELAIRFRAIAREL